MHAEAVVDIRREAFTMVGEFKAVENFPFTGLPLMQFGLIAVVKYCFDSMGVCEIRGAVFACPL